MVERRTIEADSTVGAPGVDHGEENDSKTPRNNALNEEKKEGEKRKLYKSPRFTGYLTMFLSSIINYHGVIVSLDTTDVHVIGSTGVQRQYGYIVALMTCVVSGFCVLCHLDRFTCLAKIWTNTLFAPKSKFETILDLSLLVWWFMAMVIQTRASGIAGDGKGQYNIYFSTWFCLFCAISVVESKMMEHDWPSIKAFIKSWPHRAPGWIAILTADFFTLWWYVDLYTTYISNVNEDELDPMLFTYYGSIPNMQYELLLLVAAATLLPASIFVFIEIFRDSSEDKKGSIETYIEAFCLFSLACVWIPTVCVATTPGGFAAQIGNSWFFTWATCFLVMETLLWFISDSREEIHRTLLEKEEEYRQHQLNVLAAAHDLMEDTSDSQSRYDDIEQSGDDGSSTIQLEDPPPIRKPAIEAAAFEMKDVSENEESLDDSIQEEIRMKEKDRNAYFDNLDDILE